MSSVFDSPVLNKIIIAILVKRLGGKINITQIDVDEILYNRLDEIQLPNGSLKLEFVQKELRSGPSKTTVSF